MFCSQCAARLADDAVYCHACAKPVASFSFNPANVAQVEPIEEATQIRLTPAPKKSRSGWVIALVLAFGVLAGAGIVGIAAFIFFANGPKQSSAAGNQGQRNAPTNKPNNRPDRTFSASNPTPAPSPDNPYSAGNPMPELEKPKTQIVNDHLPIQAGQYRWFRIVCASECRFTGGFRTYGGSEDIDAAVMDSISFGAWQNGSNVPAVYSQSRASRGRLNFIVPAGEYILVFSNRHAMMTPKTVSAEIYYQEL